MAWILLLTTQIGWAATQVPVQADIDKAFALIFETEVGQAICRDILGADALAIERHLGVSPERSADLAKNCGGSDPSEWVYPTSPADIRKLTLKAAKPRRYQLVQAEQTFPIESWTDSFHNVTTILIADKQIVFARLVQILAHETAVYLDSKSNPLHPGAEEIPHLRQLNLGKPGEMNPLVAISNPLQAHTLTYLRALQVEFAILKELTAAGRIQAPKDLADPYLNHLVSESCRDACINELVRNTREIYLPISLPLLAFAPHYRAVVLRELPYMNLNWGTSKSYLAQRVFNTYPVQFMKDQFTGDVVTDLSHFFYLDEQGAGNQSLVRRFVTEDLWPIESRVISETRFPSGQTLLEFMKRPLLSGYNIFLSSGPRVRVRTGNIE